jgi:hypothetical protein
VAEFERAAGAFSKALRDSGSTITDPPFMEIQPEPEINPAGFTLVNGNTWLPRPFYEARREQQCKIARKNEDFVIWTR